MGSRADQAETIVIAGFVAALAGVMMLQLAKNAGLVSVSNVGWLFLANFGFGLVWAALGYWRGKPWG